ncbi:acrB/AcrD/AcrF family protein, partial [Vibrio parahaemolyticus V-223/04]
VTTCVGKTLSSCVRTVSACLL